MTTGDNNQPKESTDTSLPLVRRDLLAGVGVLGLAGLGAGIAGADDGDDEARFARREHDHSGEYGAASRLGEHAPVESMTVDDLRTGVAPVIDVRAHGAQGDGETDDYAAIQAAVDAAGDQAVIYFPAGTYHISDAITASDTSLTFRGDGTGVSYLRFTEATDGFDIEQPSSGEADKDNERYLAVTDLTIGATQPDSGTAIKAVWDAPPSGGHPHLLVRNVNIRNDGPIDDEIYFTRGIFADNAWRARVADFHYAGYVHDIPLGDVDEFEPRMIGVEFIGRCVDASITRIHCSRCDVGVLVGRDGRRNTEGVRIHEATFVDTYKGVVAKSGPWLTVTSSHFNGRRTAVEFDNRWEAMVSDCLFYRVPWTQTSKWAGVHALDAHNILVSNITTGDLSDNPTEGHAVHVENSDECVVSGNIMNGMSWDGGSTVLVDDATRVMVSENIARDAPASVTFTESVTNSLAHGNWGTVRDDGVLNLITNNLEPFTLTQAERNNVPEDVFGGPAGMGEVADTYGQTFTVDQPFEIVELLVANFGNPDSAATVTLYGGDPAGGEELEQIATERVEEWPNIEWVRFNWSGEEPGTYYLEVSDPEITPTWWWTELPLGDADNLADVGGEALIDRESASEADLPVTDDTRREEPVEEANFVFAVHGVEQ